MKKIANTKVLPHGFKSLNKKESFILSYVYSSTEKNVWRDFNKLIVQFLSEAQGSNAAINDVVEKIYAKAVRKSSSSHRYSYSSLGLQNGYLYPTVPVVSDENKQAIIESSLYEQFCIDVIYESNKLIKNGESLKIQRLYVGKVYDYNHEAELVTLKMGEDFRSFKYSQIISVDKFDRKSQIEVRHTKLEIIPLTFGGAQVSLTEIIGESNPLIARPWNEFSTEESIKTISTAGQNSEDENIFKGQFDFDYSSLEEKLSLFYDKLITVKSKNTRTFFKLKGFSLEYGSYRMVLYGDGGITFEANLQELELIVDADGIQKLILS